MEWILWSLLALMLALLCYTVFWTSLAVGKKVQPAADSFFDALYNLLFAKPPSPKRNSHSGKSKPN